MQCPIVIYEDGEVFLGERIRDAQGFSVMVGSSYVNVSPAAPGRVEQGPFKGMTKHGVPCPTPKAKRA